MSKTRENKILAKSLSITGNVEIDGQATIGGAPLVASLAAGKIFYLDPTNGSDSNDGLTPATAKSTLTAAFALCTSGKNDTVAYIAGTSGLTLSAAFDWNKSYTHFIGVCAPTGIAQRARIFQLSSLTGASPFFTVSGSGCIFKDLYIFQGVNDATSLINVSVTGGRNYFENVHFAGGGHAAQAIDGGASLKLDGAAENTFIGCTIGVDTVPAATGMTALLFDGAAARNVFKDCLFNLYAGHAGAVFVEIADSTGIDRVNIFKDCMFLNSCRTYSLTSGFVIPASMASVTNYLLLKDCMILGTAKLDANDRAVLYGNMNDVTGADTSGVAVEMVS